MMSSWLIPVMLSPATHLIRDRRGKDTEKEKLCEDRGRDWMTQPQTRECLEPLEVGKAKKDSPL